MVPLARLQFGYRAECTRNLWNCPLKKFDLEWDWVVSDLRRLVSYIILAARTVTVWNWNCWLVVVFDCVKQKLNWIMITLPAHIIPKPNLTIHGTCEYTSIGLARPGRLSFWFPIFRYLFQVLLSFLFFFLSPFCLIRRGWFYRYHFISICIHRHFTHILSFAADSLG